MLGYNLEYINKLYYYFNAFVGYFITIEPHYIYCDKYVICVNYIKRFQTVPRSQNKTLLFSKPVRYVADICKKTKDRSNNEYRKAATKYSAALAFGNLAASHVIKT
jgi:hypothetical protein